MSVEYRLLHERIQPTPREVAAIREACKVTRAYRAACVLRRRGKGPPYDGETADAVIERMCPTATPLRWHQLISLVTERLLAEGVELNRNRNTLREAS